jgi:hypothetical protein
LGVAEIKAFGFREGGAEVVFADGLRLRVVPVDLEDPIQIRACLLLNDTGIVEAATPEGSWSGTDNIKRLAERLSSGIEAERRVYKAYRAGAIKEDVWVKSFRMFWKVMIRCRRIGEAIGADSLPRSTLEEMRLDAI